MYILMNLNIIDTSARLTDLGIFILKNNIYYLGKNYLKITELK